MKPAAFIDRDGVICEYVDNIHKVEEFKLRPQVGEAIRRLNLSGYHVFVITNQPMIGKGLLTHEGLAEIHDKMHSELQKWGAKLDSIQYCPHFPGGPIAPWNTECSCRKPQIGMIEKLCAEFPVDLKNSFLAGDTWRDIQCAEKLQLFSYGLRGGAGFPYPPESPHASVHPHRMVESLWEAVEHRLTQSRTSIS